MSNIRNQVIDKLESIVVNEVGSKKTDKHYIIKCLNKNHNDTTPKSFMIDHTHKDLVCNCFGCEFKGNIHTLAKILGIKEVVKPSPKSGLEYLEMKAEPFNSINIQELIDCEDIDLNDETNDISIKLKNSNGFSFQNISYNSTLDKVEKKFSKGSISKGAYNIVGKSPSYGDKVYLVEGYANAFPYKEAGLGAIVCWSKGNMVEVYNKLSKDDDFKGVNLIANIDNDNDAYDFAKNFEYAIILKSGAKSDAWDYYVKNNMTPSSFKEYVSDWDNAIANDVVNEGEPNLERWVAKCRSEAVFTIDKGSSGRVFFKDGTKSMGSSMSVGFTTKLLYEKVGRLFIDNQDLVNNSKNWFKVICDSNKEFSQGSKGLVLKNLPAYEIDLNKLVSFKTGSFWISFLEDYLPNNFIYGDYKEGYSVKENLLDIYDVDSSMPTLNVFDKSTLLKPDQRAVEGDWGIIRKHLLNLVGRNENYLSTLLHLLAYKSQKPLSHMPEVVCMLDSGGTGKGVFLNILNYLQNSEPLGNLGNKDKTYMIGKKFVVYDEVDAKNKGDYSSIATEIKMSSEPRLVSEAKYEKPKIIDNISLSFVFSNHLGLLEKETEANRRFFIVNGGKDNLISFLKEDYSDKEVYSYLDGLRDLIQGFGDSDATSFAKGQLNAFIHYLYNVDLNTLPKNIKTHIVNEINDENGEGTFLSFVNQLRDLDSKSKDLQSDFRSLVDDQLGYLPYVKLDTYNNASCVVDGDYLQVQMKAPFFKHMICDGKSLDKAGVKAKIDKLKKTLINFEEKAVRINNSSPAFCKCFKIKLNK